MPVLIALSLTLWMGMQVAVPYLRDGGSTNRFSIGNRTDSAADFAATDELIDCVTGLGPVWSDNPHVYNRLLYLSYGNEDIVVPESKYEAHFVINYRYEGDKAGIKCQDLTHFKVEKRK